ncbi:MAG TPA: type II toxin-antitoxin system Phd/YefM family antitoxin [Gryllotalpicola sp.]
MKTVPLDAAQAAFEDLVDEVEGTRQPIAISRDGATAAVLVPIEYLDLLQKRKP